MHTTVFDTPGLKTIMRAGAKVFLKVVRWRAVKRPDLPKKHFVIAAPHTSNWDFPLFVAIGLSINVKSYWMGKHTLFKKPFGWFFKWLGGIPIDRSRSVNTVDQFIEHFNMNEEIVLVNAPEGTRKRVEKWKSGFYHISVGANVPIAFAFLDYQKKEGGIGALFYPTGDLDKDMVEIRKFYSGVTPKYPEKYADS
jgi:1-acyl-sn-glycerol-3-phosphate acyltransferase